MKARRLKIVQVITGFRPGGAEKLLLEMYAAFDHTRFDIRLVSITGELSALQVYNHSDTPVSTFDLGGRDRLRALADLRAFLKDFAPDVVHAHMFHSLVAVFATTRFLSRKPALCFTSHLNQYTPWRAALTRMLKPWRSADIIFSGDQHPALNAVNTFVIPNGVAVAPEPPVRRAWTPGEGVRLVAVGRLADQKDPLGMLRSFAAAGLRHATLDFVGAGPLLDEARALAQSLGVAERVIFHGMRSDVKRFLAESDIFVMHSKYEGMPIALLEAAAQAMPVIATPVGSNGEILANGAGNLAETQDFALALSRTEADPVAALAMGRHLHRVARERYSIEATAAAHERIYEKISR